MQIVPSTIAQTQPEAEGGAGLRRGRERADLEESADARDDAERDLQQLVHRGGGRLRAAGAAKLVAAVAASARARAASARSPASIAGLGAPERRPGLAHRVEQRRPPGGPAGLGRRDLLGSLGEPLAHGPDRAPGVIGRRVAGEPGRKRRLRCRGRGRRGLDLALGAVGTGGAGGEEERARGEKDRALRRAQGGDGGAPRARPGRSRCKGHR